MPKKKKIVPVGGILYSVFIGFLVITMVVCLIFSWKAPAEEEKENEVSYGSYRVSELR